MAPTTLRPSGEPPLFAPGRQILWHYRRPDWVPGSPQFVVPATVVRDDADALVAWVPAGTPYLAPIRSDGRVLRESTGFPFDQPWQDWRPDPAWPLPPPPYPHLRDLARP